jgi:anti-sigma factor RsiW
MPECSIIDPLVTPFVDGELADADREIVERHIGACRSCRSRVLGERAVREVVAAHRRVICSAGAPHALRARCADLRMGTTAPAPAGSPATWRARLGPLAAAATLVMIVGGAFLYQLTISSSSVMAAELTADHVKCFTMNGVLGTHQTAEVVESSMASGFDWRVRLPRTDQAGLELVGSRPCLYGEGRVAHIMFLHNGTPVSLFMLPKTTRSDELVRVLGHEAAIWSVGDRTFVLIARETRSEVERMAAFVQSSLR